MKPLVQQNLYEILDVPFDATAAAIAEAVERAQALHAPGSLATYTLMDPDEELLVSRLIEEARVTLLDPVARARYDERITGPDEVAPPPAPPASPAADAAIRLAWPELPPVIPAARTPPDEDWEDEPRAPAAVSPALPAAEPASPSPPARPPPILLSREVASAPPAAPATTPVPMVLPSPGPAAIPVPDDTTWSGEVLRKIREARGITLQQISERTKVTRHHIENVEADRFELLPAAVYLRGILLSVARELRLDGQKVARSYLERVAAACASTSPIPRPK